MFAPGKKSFAVVTAVAAITYGMFGIDAAWADASIVVSPATGLSANEPISVTLDGYTPNALASAQVAECGNAYADGTPLSAMPATTPGLLDAKNCEVIGFLNPGAFSSAPAVLSGPTTTVRQTAIGTGNRSCVEAPPAIAPCFVYVSTSVNLPPFPTTPITFADPPEITLPAPTSTTVSAVGSPVGLGKTAHVLVTVGVDSDPTLKPDGDVSVYEGETLLGTGSLGADGTVSVAIGSPPLGLHAVTATFDGNGSFAGSTSSTAANVSIISADNITIGDTTMVEGDAGTRTLTFPIVLSRPSTSSLGLTYTYVGGGPGEATVGAATAPGTEVVRPTATSASKNVIFKAGQTVKYVTVKVIGDTTDEDDETFSVVLSNITGAPSFVLRKAIGTGTIQDDDGTPKSGPLVDIGFGSVPEGDAGGVRSLKVTVTLSSAQPTQVEVFVQTTSLTANRGTKLNAGLNSDWGGPVLRRIVFKAGQTSRPFAMATFPDTVHEFDKTVRYKIQTVIGATAGPRSETIGTILSDE